MKMDDSQLPFLQDCARGFNGDVILGVTVFSF